MILVWFERSRGDEFDSCEKKFRLFHRSPQRKAGTEKNEIVEIGCEIFNRRFSTNFSQKYAKTTENTNRKIKIGRGNLFFSIETNRNQPKPTDFCPVFRL